jgi:hypothetical protein
VKRKNGFLDTCASSLAQFNAMDVSMMADLLERSSSAGSCQPENYSSVSDRRSHDISRLLSSPIFSPFSFFFSSLFQR